MQEMPAPGTYDPKNMYNIPRWKFGAEIRGKIKKNEVPGPGQYDMKSTIANVPAYLLNN